MLNKKTLQRDSQYLVSCLIVFAFLFFGFFLLGGGGVKKENQRHVCASARTAQLPRTCARVHLPDAQACSPSQACGARLWPAESTWLWLSKTGTQNGTLVSGNMDQNLRSISWWLNFDPYPCGVHLVSVTTPLKTAELFVVEWKMLCFNLQRCRKKALCKQFGIMEHPLLQPKS